jgi:hypothetical protein
MGIPTEGFYVSKYPNPEMYDISVLRELCNVLRDLLSEDNVNFEDHKILLEEAEEVCNNYNPYDNDEMNKKVVHLLKNDVLDAINENAPPYMIFGPKSSSEWGWQIDFDSLQFNEVPCISEDDLDENYQGEVVVVNDHGNASLLYINEDGKKELIWSVV